MRPVKALAVSFPAVLRIANAYSDDDTAVGRMLSVQIFVPTNGLRMLTYVGRMLTYVGRMLSVQMFVPTNSLRMLTYADVC